MPEVDPLNLPFDEAIKFFRQKVRIPTRRWNDLWQGMHSRGFMIAGAMRDELLSDFQESIAKAIETGTTEREFLKDFDTIVEKHGWSYKGERGWRARTIFENNLNTAYSAGRYQQQTDPAVLRRRPFWMYVHGDSANPRKLHKEWDGTILPADDDWWRTHYGPNGWGCTCSVLALSKREAEREGGVSQRPSDGTYEWTDPKTGEVHTVPAGIDPGWDYNPGETYLGKGTAQKILAGERDKWVPLPGKDHAFFNRPETVPVDEARAALGERAESPADMRRLLREAIGGDEVFFKDPTGQEIMVNQELVDHVLELGRRQDDRVKYFPFIPEIITDPYEVWIGFARNERTGKVGLRRRYVKIIRTDKTHTHALVAESVQNVWTGVTMFRGKPSYAKNMRQGFLLWGR